MIIGVDGALENLKRNQRSTQGALIITLVIGFIYEGFEFIFKKNKAAILSWFCDNNDIVCV